jgi:hypothetical protein
MARFLASPDRRKSIGGSLLPFSLVSSVGHIMPNTLCSMGSVAGIGCSPMQPGFNSHGSPPWHMQVSVQPRRCSFRIQ